MNDDSKQVRQIYDTYPRKKAPRDAIRAIEKAVANLVKLDKSTPLEARRKLYKATLMYARSVEGMNPDRTKVPYPATWYNRESYLEDPKEWQHGGFSNGSVSRSKADSNMGVLAKILSEGKHSRGADQDGEFPAGAHGRNDAQKLLHRP